MRSRHVDHAKVDQYVLCNRLTDVWFDRRHTAPDERVFPIDKRLRHNVIMWIAVIIIFVLGVGNFTIHYAVLESGRLVTGLMPQTIRFLGGRLSLIAEFLVLLVTMLLAANGWPELVWGYLAYSALNGLAAWLLVSGRI